MLYLTIRYFKLYLFLASGLSGLGFVAAASAETAQPAAQGSKRVTSTEVSAANSNTQSEVSIIMAPEAIAVTTTQMSQAVPITVKQIQTEPTPTIDNQVTSVSQLADVQPTDWAFGALQSLIERYGVVAGYPDGTYRGNRAMTRYEFAAGLNAALERVNELIQSRSDSVSRDDLVTLQRLQEEFVAELTTLQGRVDTLEASTAELEANQFSTTTKLLGQVIFAANAGGFSGDRIVDPTGIEIADEDPSATIVYRVALDFNTSFSGTDLLKIRLDGLSGRGGNDNAAGFLDPNFGSALEFTTRGVPNPNFGVSRLYYTFTPLNNLSLTIGPAIVTTDYVDRNSYASGILDFSTLALVNNYLLFPVNGPSSGAVLDWNPGQGPFKVRALYAAADAANPNSNNQRVVPGVFPFARLLYPNGGGDRGLFGDPDQGTVELEYAPSRALALRLQYSLGNVFDGSFDVFGANFELALSRQLAVFGRYGYGSYNDTAFGDIEPNYWMAGVSFRDLFVPGALAGVAAGQPFIDNAIGNATQTNIEAFYNFPVSDNIRITPLVQVIANPANQDSNGTIITGTLRTVFSF